MGSLLSMFYKITGGRPMKTIDECRFVDVVVGRPVGLYEDCRNGDRYLAFSAWDLGRVKVK